MAPPSSDSSSSGTFPRKPEVFISFGGKDTRSGITSHIYAALLRKKIDAYIDDQLEKGCELSSQLLSAIEKSKLSIIIFSENYAYSKWCLDELVKIMDCEKRYGQIVVPVFYNIDPSDIRYPKRRYGDAFVNDHNLRYDQSQVCKWKDALSQAANLSGWPWPSPDMRGESAFVDAIVRDVIQKLSDKSSYEYSKRLVGINEHIANVESLLCGEPEEVRAIGIWGKGGSGKTTIAEAVFHKLSLQYEGSCFLANVREKIKRKGTIHLLNKLFSELLDGEKPRIGTSCVESFSLNRVRRKKVLIVLDDISDSLLSDQMVEEELFGQGSRIILTSRDKHVLNKVDVYEVPDMEFHQALQLFSMFAFGQNDPPKDYRELSEGAVSYAAGNPLALRVLGSFLCNRSRREWESALEKHSKISNPTIQGVLRISYEALDDEEKKIFRYACFLNGAEKEFMISLLNYSGISADIGLKTLQDKSFITITSDNRVSVPNLIQGMCRQVVREESNKPEKHSWLWNAEDISDVLEKEKGTEAIEGIVLNISELKKKLHLKPDSFANMINLKILNIYGLVSKASNVDIPEDLNALPDGLRFLDWTYVRLKTLPSDFRPEYLIGLVLTNSCLEKLWGGDKNLPFLKSIDISFSHYLTELPDLSNASKLERVYLRQCVSLHLVSASTFNLNRITELDMAGCKNVTSFQSDTHSKSLEWLNLSGCSSLTEFSVSSENMKYLNLGGTPIQQLPPSIGRNRKLKDLILKSCRNLQSLPSSLSQLGCLKLLDLSDCPKLEKLFPTFDGLQSLETLYLDNSLGLSKVPNLISRSSSLKCLSLSGSNIEYLPASVKDIPQLKELVLRDCKNISCLPQLPSSIQQLNASNCISLTTVLTSSAELSLGSLLEKSRGLYRRGYSELFIFYNCKKLNESALSKILGDAYSRIQRAVYQSSRLEESEQHQVLVTICLPGSQVPDWFIHRAVKSSITIKLEKLPIRDLKLLRFAFGLVFDASSSCIDEGHFLYLSIRYKIRFEAKCGGKIIRVEYPSEVSPILLIASSDHVYVWYDNDFCRVLLKSICGKYDEFDYIECPKITFEFSAQINGVNRVKRCGVLVLPDSLHGQCH